MPSNILVRGRPGSGKTTLVVELVKRMAAHGFKAGGFVTEEIREGSHRVGFMVRDLNGDTEVLAHIAFKGPYRVGKYGIDVDAFERIIADALDIREREAELLVVDEIGRMELASSIFRSTILELLESPVPLLATMHAGNDSFTASILNRYDVQVFQVNATTRGNILEVIYESLSGILRDKKVSRGLEGGMRS